MQISQEDLGQCAQATVVRTFNYVARQALRGLATPASGRTLGGYETPAPLPWRALLLHAPAPTRLARDDGDPADDKNDDDECDGDSDDDQRRRIASSSRVGRHQCRTRGHASRRRHRIEALRAADASKREVSCFNSATG
jgi:hypothetical protein